LALALGAFWTMRNIDAPRAEFALVVAEHGDQSPLGAPAGLGAALALQDEVTAGRLALHRLDTKSDNARAASLCATAAPTATLGLGFTDTDPALASVPSFTKAGKPFVVIGATDPSIPALCGAGTFLACFSDQAQAVAAATFGTQRFGKRVLVIFDARSQYARTLAGFFKQWLDEDGRGTVVKELDLAFVPASRLGPHMISERGRADFVFVACEPQDVGGVVAGVREADAQLPIIGGDAFDCDAVLRTVVKPTERVWFTTHAWLGAGASAEAQEFSARYKKAYGALPPNAFAALGYDAARLALDARRRAGSDDPKAITAALAATRDFRGVTGTISYANGPVPTKDVWMVAVVKGERTLAGH
jgi:branched-chain amino acid transport system substrate-binding protein